MEVSEGEILTQAKLSRNLFTKKRKKKGSLETKTVEVTENTLLKILLEVILKNMDCK